MRIAVPGDRGIDYSGARPTAHATAQAGGKFIVRYSAGVGNGQSATQWKLCEKNEIHDAVAAGMDFIANSEWYESRITEGARAGHDDGVADLGFWKSRGLARGASIFVSWDQDPTRSLWGAALSYLQAYDRALEGYFHVDAYAGTQFLKYALAHHVIKYGWRTNAGSWSNDGLPYQPRIDAAMLARARKATPAAIWQTGNYWWSNQADENVLLRPVMSHLAAVVASTPKPAPRPVPAKPTNSILPPHGWQHATVLVDQHGRLDVQYNGKHVRYI